MEATTLDEAVTKSPRTHVDSAPLPTDSMVTVPLSEAGTPQDDESAESTQQPHIVVDGSKAFARRLSDASATSEPVDWTELDKLEKKEEQEPDGEGPAMALLLARLEQENNALLSDAKAGLTATATTTTAAAASQSRPPSLNQLRRLLDARDDDAAQVRLSQLPSPPPMTELEFWAALVRDYPQTVQRLPTLCLNKIRGGIPAPLRGVVWQSAAASREKLVEAQYDSLCGEASPYENLINKDLGRSFPGVDMFKHPDGDGQKMLGRVLKGFSLYDDKIGYCQGLGFLVGPLLMQMGDREAFCVLVRLMEDYDLRSCFLPDLSGLHLRIFQFQQLLAHHMPLLAKHLDDLDIQSAYLSQWFLSFFAVTCPLPMLFRIYDVLFAEGASETIMRVALALMKRNEQKLLALTEFEDVMQLLLGRQLWDPYGRNAGSADELVNDFVAFTNDVTRERLHALEQQYKESQEKDLSKHQVQKSAMSFLGRLWGPSNSSTKSVTLSPGLTAPSRPVSFLRRSASKQSLASTLNSNAESDASAATQSTALTDVSRGSSADAASLKSGHGSAAMGHSTKDRDLHYQIEQLLMSVSQLQRQNSQLEAAMQKQREDRKEDHRIVRTVVDKIRKKKTVTLAPPTTRSLRRRTTITAATLIPPPDESPAADLPKEAVEIVDTLETRFPFEQTHHRASSMFETKEVLRENMARVKEQLASETLRAQSLARDLNDRDAELQSAREALKDTRHRLQESYNQNQKNEKTIQDLRLSARKHAAAASLSSSSSSSWNVIDHSPDTTPTLSRSTTADSISTGLRELRLGRTPSQKSAQAPSSVFSKRSSSLATQQVLATDDNVPADNEALLLELVNSKTAEAVAKQELEELRAKFDAMKRVISAQATSSGPGLTRSPSASPGITVEKKENQAAAGGWNWGGWKRTVSSSGVAN